MVKKKTEIEAPVNAALQASITPVGIEFGMNKLRLGENYCRIYGIFMLPTEVEYGWLSKLTNIPGTIVTINYETTCRGKSECSEGRRQVQKTRKSA